MNRFSGAGEKSWLALKLMKTDLWNDNELPRRFKSASVQDKWQNHYTAFVEQPGNNAFMTYSVLSG
jgi:hypothetical protein